MVRRFRQTRKRVDEGSVGISFVDVLFALVIGKILDAVSWPHVHPLWTIQHANLALASMLTLTSWVGYHNSANRPKFKIRFFNWPLVQFTLDIAMVFLYWTAASAAGSSSNSDHLTTQMALIVFETFVLYFIWDIVGIFIGRNTDYQTILKADPIWKNEDPWSFHPARASATPVLMIAAGAIWVASRHGTFHSHTGAYTADALVGLVLILFRFWKDGRWEVVTEARAQAAAG